MKNIEVILLNKLAERKSQLQSMVANWNGEDREMELEITQVEDDIDMIESDLMEIEE